MVTDVQPCTHLCAPTSDFQRPRVIGPALYAEACSMLHIIQGPSLWLVTPGVSLSTELSQQWVGWQWLLHTGHICPGMCPLCIYWLLGMGLERTTSKHKNPQLPQGYINSPLYTTEPKSISCLNTILLLTWIKLAMFAWCSCFPFLFVMVFP